MANAGDPIESTDVTTLEDYTIRKPLVRLTQQVAQSIPSGTGTALTFGAGSEEIDTHGFHDETTNNTRITPTVAGYYRLSGSYVTSAMTSPTALSITFAKNGATFSSVFRYSPGTGSGSRSAAATTITSANGSTDYFTLIAEQSSAGALNSVVVAPLQSVFECEFIRPL